MRKRIRHIKARSNEWVKIHRSPSQQQSGGNDIVIKAGLYLIGTWVALWIFSQIWPILAAGVIAYFALRFWLKK